MLVILIGIILITLQLTHEKIFGFWDSLRHAAFQVISLTSTTGLVTADTSVWPIFSIIILCYFSIQCGMVGSTAGGIKFDRVYLFFSSVKKTVKTNSSPRRSLRRENEQDSHCARSGTANHGVHYILYPYFFNYHSHTLFHGGDRRNDIFFSINCHYRQRWAGLWRGRVGQ